MTGGGSYTRSVSITVDLNAIRSNLITARQLSGGGRIFATIKADAYGHGAVAVARALQGAPASQTDTLAVKPQASSPATGESSAQLCMSDAHGNADGFAVVTVDEAMELRDAGVELPVLVLQGPRSADDCELFRLHRLWPVIHDLHQLAWIRQVKGVEQLQCWLKIDTGMGRLGFLPDTVSELLAQSGRVRWQGVLTHFACADEVDNPYTQWQIEQFSKVTQGCELQSSLANSAAVLAWPASRSDWARPGIMLYGCNPLDRSLPEGVSLLPAMSVHAPLISVKRLSAGTGIGYAQTWHCPEDMPVGYVAAGYRDGFPRVVDETAAVLVDGRICPVVGRVSMDSIAVDLRACLHASPGMQATLWSPEWPVDRLASAAGTISYEMLTSIRGQRSYS